MTYVGDVGAATAVPRERADVRAWWLVAGLLIAAFLARAPLYLSVFPPFEGWDEYQHLGYIAHLDETGTMPLYDARVPLAIRPLVIAMPHSEWGGAQVIADWGALAYADYWEAPKPTADGAPAASPRLYQAQHPPLAYAIALPVWRALKTTHALEAIYVIRAMNLLLAAAALALFAAALRRLVPAFAPRVAVLALVCLHPLFFQNVARVANDPLAVATGLAGISLLLIGDRRTLLLRGVLAAACIAAGVWSKQTGLTLIPALVLGLPLIGRTQRVAAGRLWGTTAMAVVVLLIAVAPLWAWSYRQYGSIVTTQESIELAQRGAVLTDALATSIVTMNWRSLIDTLFIPGRPWVGGWSFLRMDETLKGVYGWYWSLFVAAACVGGGVALLRRARPHERGAADGSAAGLVICAAVVVFTVLGLIHHALVSHAVFGQSMTNPWYFMTALPFLFVLLVRGLEALGRGLATAAAAALAALYVAIELHGTWVQMPAGYTKTTATALQWARLSAIHPAALSGDLRWVFLAIHLGALCLVVGALVYLWRQHAKSTDGVTTRDPATTAVGV